MLKIVIIEVCVPNSFFARVIQRLKKSKFQNNKIACLTVRILKTNFCLT